jgi:hypothetical protein
LKSFLTIILALIALCGGFYALVRFSGLDPEEFFLKSSEKSEFRGSVEPNKLQVLYDSLESINFVIRRETDERQLKTLKETQKNLWARIVLTRNALSQTTDSPQSVKEGETELIDSLIKGISITAAILLSIIIFLIIKITRRSKEVEKVTERLKSLQAEPPPPPPLGGMDPTVIPQRYRPNPLPQVKPYEQKSEPEPPAPTVEMPKQTTQQPPLRKTAKQRVTEAVQKMRDALDRLRSEGTQKMRSPSDPTGVRGLTKTQIRVPSLNSTRITPSGDETSYDRRGRDNKQILNYAKQGRTSSEISKWLNLPRDQVETVIRLARERGEV